MSKLATQLLITEKTTLAELRRFVELTRRVDPQQTVALRGIIDEILGVEVTHSESKED